MSHRYHTTRDLIIKSGEYTEYSIDNDYIVYIKSFPDGYYIGIPFKSKRTKRSKNVFLVKSKGELDNKIKFLSEKYYEACDKKKALSDEKKLFVTEWKEGDILYSNTYNYAYYYKIKSIKGKTLTLVELKKEKHGSYVYPGDETNNIFKVRYTMGYDKKTSASIKGREYLYMYNKNNTGIYEDIYGY